MTNSSYTVPRLTWEDFLLFPFERRGDPSLSEGEGGKRKEEEVKRRELFVRGRRAQGGGELDVFELEDLLLGKWK
jgi:hypothetical protein